MCDVEVVVSVIRVTRRPSLIVTGSPLIDETMTISTAALPDEIDVALTKESANTHDNSTFPSSMILAENSFSPRI